MTISKSAGCASILQVVDMRWGVRHEASVDHSASELCMKEIKTCNEVSLGPTFVVSLCDKQESYNCFARWVYLSVVRKDWPFCTNSVKLRAFRVTRI